MSRLLALIGQPARIQILFVISEQEACVCHLEAVLMALRKAGLVEASREGRNIFYRLTQPEVMQLLDQAARLGGIRPAALHRLAERPAPGCPCPQCNPGMDPSQTCGNLPSRAAKKTGQQG
jgi:ArsR family transcriptional regulator